MDVNVFCHGFPWCQSPGLSRMPSGEEQIAEKAEKKAEAEAKAKAEKEKEAGSSATRRSCVLHPLQPRTSSVFRF